MLLRSTSWWLWFGRVWWCFCWWRSNLGWFFFLNGDDTDGLFEEYVGTGKE